jgi:hypothetical protein
MGDILDWNTEMEVDEELKIDSKREMRGGRVIFLRGLTKRMQRSAGTGLP